MIKLPPSRILVVDDLEGIRFSLRVHFESQGHTVFEAEGGHDAWNFLSMHPVDVVVTDLEMANGDGLQLVERIKLAHAASPVVIVMTGSPDTVMLELAYALGAEGVLLKPFELAMLDETIGRLGVPLERRHKRPRDGVVLRLEQPLQVATNGLTPGRCRIGRGGIFVMTQNLPKPGSRVSFSLELPSFSSSTTAGFIQGVGLVRWTRAAERDNLPPGFGLEFDQLPKHAVEILARWTLVERLLPFIPRG